MPGCAAAALRHQSIELGKGFPLFDSQFDPIEMWETYVPFVDPFSYDQHTFRADATAPQASMKGASLSSLHLDLPMLTSPIPAHPQFLDTDDPYRFQYPYPHQDPLQPRRIMQLAAITINTHKELPEVVPERVRLSPDQAIYIFQLRSTRTSRTAALLSAKFGITPKAIRDIWTRRSWADDTRPFWTLLDV